VYVGIMGGATVVCCTATYRNGPKYSSPVASTETLTLLVQYGCASTAHILPAVKFVLDNWPLRMHVLLPTHTEYFRIIIIAFVLCMRLPQRLCST
jgi:hypothetical protein